MNPNETTEILWKTFRDRLRAFVRSRVSDDETAADILQQAFLLMHQALRKGKTLEDPRSWVFAVTRNVLTDHYRAVNSQISRVAKAGREPNTPLEEDAESQAFFELARCVEPLLQGLEPSYRKALQWTVFHGMTQKAAAQKANVSLSGMKSRIQRGRRKLRDLFEKCCAIEVDARGKPMETTHRGTCTQCPGPKREE